jgi:hypothetical protein
MTHGALWAALWVGSQMIIGWFAYERGWRDCLNALRGGGKS